MQEGACRCDACSGRGCDSRGPAAAASRSATDACGEAARKNAVPFNVAIQWHPNLTTLPTTPRRFFEALYSSFEGVLHEAFGRLGRGAAIETQLGELFRWGAQHCLLAPRTVLAPSACVVTCKRQQAHTHAQPAQGLCCKHACNFVHAAGALSTRRSSATGRRAAWTHSAWSRSGR